MDQRVCGESREPFFRSRRPILGLYEAEGRVEPRPHAPKESRPSKLTRAVIRRTTIPVSLAMVIGLSPAHAVTDVSNNGQVGNLGLSASEEADFVYFPPILTDQ
jgi:hypothetical protein